MKIVLTQDVKNLGKKGDIKNVADGYALNFILPKKLGIVATEETVREFEARKAQENESHQKMLEKNRALAEKLQKFVLKLEMKAKDGKLFGSINAKNIAEELQKKDFAISEKCVKIKEAIKSTGRFEIEIDLGENIRSRIKLEIEEQK